jgi:hypothetical protein
LQRGQVKQARAGFGGGLALFGDGGWLVAHGIGNGQGLGFRPHAVVFFLGVFRVFFVVGVEPFGWVAAGFNFE